MGKHPADSEITENQAVGNSIPMHGSRKAAIAEDQD